MRAGLLLVAACTLLVLGWLLLWPSPAESLAPIPDAPMQEDVSTATHTTESLREPTLPRQEVADRTAVAEDTAILIRLVRSDTGEVIPDHEIWLTSPLSSDLAGVEKFSKRNGQRIRTDTTGIARIENPFPRMNLFARKDHLTGFLQVYLRDQRESGEAETTLELVPELTISIRVIDAAGNLVPGMNLNAELVQGDDAKKNWGGGIGRTNEAGIALWKDYPLVLKQGERMRGGTFTALRITASVPGAGDDAFLDITPLPTHTRGYELQLPPTGTLTVRLLDPSGALVAGKRTAIARPLLLDQKNGKWGRNGRYNAPLIDGVAVFPAVALNKHFAVMIQGIYTPELHADIAGPSDDNIAVTADLVLEDSRVMWHGRLVDAVGNALSSTDLGGEVNFGKKRFSDYSGTDSAGWFHLVFPPAAVGADLSLAQIKLRTGEQFDLLPKSPFRRGIHELGEISLDPTEQFTLLTGEIVSAPEAACESSLAIRVDQRESSADEWHESRVLAKRTGSRFTITGPLTSGEYRLRVTPLTRCFIPPEPIPFTPGQEGLTVRLEAGHSLLVHAFMPEGPRAISHNLLKLLLRPTSGVAAENTPDEPATGIPARNYIPHPRAPHELEWNGLLPGIYNLEAWVADLPTPLRTVSDIQIPGADGQAISIEIDLSKDLQEFHLHLQTPDGEAPAKGASALLVRDDKALTTRSYSAPGQDELLVVAPPGAFGLWIMSPGFQPVWIRILDQDQDVILTPSRVEVAVQLRREASLPDGVGLMIHLESQLETPPGWQVPAGGEPKTPLSTLFFKGTTYLSRNWPREVTGLLDARGEAALTIYRGGPQTIRIELVPTTAERRATWPKEKIWIDGVSPARFNAQASGTEQSLHITIPTATLEAALQKAGMR